MSKKLEENIDFYYNENGYIVFTKKHHLERGTCCGNGCINCPFDYNEVPEPKRSELKAKRLG